MLDVNFPPRKIFMTEIHPATEVFSVVPYDSELQGMCSLGGQSMMVWSTREGVGARVPTKRVAFYCLFGGTEMPEDAGEMVGTMPCQVEMDGEPFMCEALIFRKTEQVN